MHPATCYPFEPEPPRRTESDIAEPLIHLWVLRILMPLGGLQTLMSDAYDTPGLLLKLDVSPDAIDADVPSARLQQASAAIRPLWKRAERTAAKLAPPAALASNIQRLAALVQLPPTECRILEFACLLHAVRDLDDAADSLGLLTSQKLHRVIEQLLGLTAAEVKLALSPSGQLARCGLMSLSRDSGNLLRAKLELLSDHFADAMLDPDTEPLSLLKGVVAPSRPAKLGLSDYPHLGQDLPMLSGYLQDVLTQQKSGC